MTASKIVCPYCAGSGFTDDTIGARLLRTREKAGITQAEAAKRIGVEPSQLSRWERGLNEPSAPGLVSISRVYRITLDWLLTGDQP